MRIVQTINSIDVEHGGTSRCVPALCDALTHCADQVHLVSSRRVDAIGSSVLPSERTVVHVHSRATLIDRLLLGRRFAETLARIARGNRTIVHDNGLWLRTNHSVAAFCRRNGIPRVVSPHGMSTDWAMANSRWKKLLAWRLYQRHDLFTAQGVHATSEQEAQELRQLGATQPIAVLGNGIVTPATLPARQPRDGTQVLFLSRIHPKKGLLNLVKAWKETSLPPDWTLVIAGPDEAGHEAEVRHAAAQAGVNSSIRFFGSADDNDKWQLYANSDFFILPSFSENFGIVVAEALYSGLPVITTTRTPWQSVVEHRCGWWVEPTSDAIAQSLREAIRVTPDQRAEMSKRCKQLANNYSWDGIAKDMMQFYEYLRDKEANTRPSFVI